PLAPLLAAEKGRIGGRYILGGDDLSLAEILAVVAELSGRKKPRLRLPIAPLMPVAWLAEGLAGITGKEPFVTQDGLRMARKKMYFSSAKAASTFGYAPRPVREGLAEAIVWFRQQGYCP